MKDWLIRELKDNRQLRMYSFWGIKLACVPAFLLIGWWSVPIYLGLEVIWWVWSLWALDKFDEINTQFELVRGIIRSARQKKRLKQGGNASEKQSEAGKEGQ